MVPVIGDLRVVLQHVNSDNNVLSSQVYHELVGVKINCGLVKICIKELNKLWAIVDLIIRIIIHQGVPISFPNPIQKYMAITMNIAKEPREIFLSKYSGSHEACKPPPEYVGGNQD